MESSRVQTQHLLEVIKAYVRDVGLVNHQLGSFNELVTGNGIKHVLQKFFHLSRDVQVKSSNIYKTVNIDLQFMEVHFEKPTRIVRNEGNRQNTAKVTEMYPSMIRKTRSNYEADMFFDMLVQLTPTFTDGRQGQPAQYPLKRVSISAIPIMVKSILCNLHGKTPVELHEVFEDDPTDPGGYFLVKGHEWVIASTESVLYNSLRVTKQGKQNQVIEGMIMSREHESGFGNSYQCHFRLHEDFTFTIEVNQTSYESVKIPFHIFFRMFGATSDKQIARYVLFDENDHSPITEAIWNVLNQCFQKITPEFESIKDERNQNEILFFVGQILTRKTKEEDIKSGAMDKQKLTAFTHYFFNKQYMTQFSAEGSTQEDAMQGKLMYTGLVIRQIIMCRLGIISVSDRDSYKYKRINTPGVQYAKEFKTVLSTYLVKPVMSRIADAIDQPGFDYESLDVKGIVEKSINKQEINKILRQTLSSGNDVVFVKQKSVPNRISSQEQHRKNGAFTLQSLRQISTNEGKIGSQNERAAELRQVHPSYLGFLCPFQTPETGHKIGMNKQMTIMAQISNSTESTQLYSLLKSDSRIIPLKDVHLPDILHLRMGKVFVNGKWFGCTRDQVFALREHYVEKRRRQEIHEHTTVVVDPLNNTVNFYTDSGRILRPIMIVHRDENDKPYAKMTVDVIDRLIQKKLTFQELIRDQVMEYISADEQDNCLIAQNVDVFFRDLNDPTKRYTHIDIEQAILGIMALIDPFANHSQPQRCCFETQQAKQACSWPFLNYPSRFNKTAYMQHICEKPIVKTVANDFMLPGGQNIIVAIMITDGYNQEDSVIFNRASVERGIMFLTHYTYQYTELEKNEMLGHPDENTLEVKTNASYEKLDSRGIIKKGSIVKKGDVLVSKKQKVNRQNEEGTQTVDTSLIYDATDMMLVDEIVYQDSGETPFVKIKMKQPKPIIEGDKFSSREGCKGVVGQIKEASEMPFTEDGIIPDMILSTLSVPTRMIVGELIEMLVSRHNIAKGIITDGTCFSKVDVYDISERLEKMGLNPFSNEVMYDGKTGEKLEYRVFNSVVFQQRLQKFPGDALYVAAGGPRNSTTRQPLEGKNQKGGIRIGEMENWCLEAHGATKMQREKLHLDSDGYTQYICQTCGTQDVIVNIQREYYRCDVCQENANIVAVPSCWTNNVFFKEVEAMGVGLRFNIKPTTYFV